ncbi:MAG: hypothetical protein ABEI76_05800 [Halobacteriales archaeon]
MAVVKQTIERLLADNSGIVFRWELLEYLDDRVQVAAIDAAIDAYNDRPGTIVLETPSTRAVYEKQSAPDWITSVGDVDG